MSGRPASGLVLGKFMPPHAGHLFLCDFARAACDRLTILVCSLPGDAMPGERRAAWMRELYPDCRVIWCNEIVPQEPAECPDFWPIWREVVARHVGRVDAVFASEDYGHRLAAELGARFIPCDPLRETVPVSATTIRADPFAAWSFIPRAVRPWFVKRVCVFGPESSGKTTLARALAPALGATLLPEYGRTWTENFGVGIDARALREIADGHVAARNAALRVANRILIEDTDPILTCVWSDMLLGEREAWMGEVLDPADLYLLTDIDFDWVDDGTRYFPDPERRRLFHERCRQELVGRDLPFVEISGRPAERLQTTLKAVKARFNLADG
ncbi:MAG: AAA family ATPase [Alphaproteobacteria bacterium]|nr:AAA family ATPase [Alphaproteobacteria bacterium]MBU4041111.1 AAA family ATPase [Alphaproteobacteria bacterium]